MTNVTETNWRIQFWNHWEEWADTGNRHLLRLFPSPVMYMRWAEKRQPDLDDRAPWEFVQHHGAWPYLEYLKELSMQTYWNQVCQEWLEKRKGTHPSLHRGQFS